MSSKRVELNDSMLEMISGGSITYHPEYPGAKNGTIGIDGNYTYTYSDEQAVFKYYDDHCKDKNWSSLAERDQYLIDGMLAAKIIK